MECRVVINSLSDFIDGPNLWISDNEIRSIEDHLVTCPKCQSVRLELTEIKNAARELPMHTPSRAMWTRIVNIVELELPRNERPTREEPEPMGWWKALKSRKFTVTFPQLAGTVAFAVALIVLGVLFSPSALRALKFTDAQTAVLPEESELRAEIDRRMAAIETRKAAWDPQLRGEFDQHLLKIEESLKLCREKLKANPQDAVHQSMLRALYTEKQQLLEDVERLKW